MEVKDSGRMREFDTGAHRDACEGKGRCDLLPLKCVANVMNDDVISNIVSFVKTCSTSFIYQAINCAVKTCPQYKNLANMMLEVSHLYEDGAKKYGANNWTKGMPATVYIDSGVRHYLKTLRGDDDEPHYRGFVWNMLNLAYKAEQNPELVRKELANMLDSPNFNPSNI